MFSQSVIENLGYYVYFLRDPRTSTVFYVGKGVENRIFQHVECAIEGSDGSDKLDNIRDILSSGHEVQHFILRHGLTEEAAFEVEASIIDFIGKGNLSNLQTGHYSEDYGIKTTDEITSMYDAEDFATDENVLLININKLYHRDMTATELYDATRKAWVIADRRNKAKYAIATYRGLTREVYTIDNWYEIESSGKQRFGFNGELADDKTRKQFRYKSIKEFFPKGAANPIKYINC